MSTEQQEQDIGLIKLNKDLKAALKKMSRTQARYLIDAYYSAQQDRMRQNLRSKSAEKAEESHVVLDWFKESSGFIEKQLAGALKVFAESESMGRWALSIVGVGPITAAGLCALVDMDRAHSRSAVWRFFGMDPTSKWGKGEKRPWCAAAKQIAYFLGESFVKTNNNPDSFYGRIYKERKALEQQKNERGEYAEQAKAALGAKKYGKETEARKHYEGGKLPPAHIHARARRYAVKMFLSHWWEEAYRQKFEKEPPEPYAISILGHQDKVNAPV